MPLTDAQIAFIDENSSAAMITIAKDGTPRPVRVSVGVIDGNLWSSGTRSRVRTARLRRDPRCALYVHEAQARWLGVDATVRLIEGPEALDANERLFRHFQGRPEGPVSWFGKDMSVDEFRQQLVDDGRLVYELDVHRTYGMI